MLKIANVTAVAESLSLEEAIDVSRDRQLRTVETVPESWDLRDEQIWVPKTEDGDELRQNHMDGHWTEDKEKPKIAGTAPELTCGEWRKPENWKQLEQNRVRRF